MFNTFLKLLFIAFITHVLYTFSFLLKYFMASYAWLENKYFTIVVHYQ